MIRLDAGAASMVGQVRSANEDAYLVTDDLVAVADGMGGHRAGEVASAATVQVLGTMAGHRSLADLVLAVHMANRTINDRAADDEDLRGMGTTVCVVGTVDEDGEHVAVLNVGDSRVYLHAAGELRQLTEDHSLVETLVREGRITPEEAEVHPQRNVLTRALGVEALVVVDAWLLAPCDGDRLLLCSDGLFNELDEDRIAELLGAGDGPEAAAQRLAAEADAAGGRDNITAVVVDVLDVGRPAEPLDGRYRRIATPTVDLDDVFHDPANDTATVPLVPISPVPDGDARAGTDEVEPDPDPDDESEGDVDDDATPALRDGEPGAESSSAEAGSSEALADAPVASGVDDAHAQVEGEPDDEADAAGADDDEHRRRSWRTPAFLLAVVLVLVAAFGVVLYNAGQGYFVGADDDRVVIYRGQPDGFLWVQPDTVRTSDVELADLTPKQRSDVEGERRRYDDLRGAQRYVTNLERSTTTTTTTTTTTSTTSTTTTTAAPAPPPTPPA